MKNSSGRYEVGLNLTLDASHSYLITIDLLGEGDLKTSLTTAQKAANQAAQTGAITYSRYVKVHNRPMLDALLASIAEQADEKNNPLISFEGHGNPEKGLLIGGAKTYVPWVELREALRRINASTRNGTGVIMSTCYGMAICDGIEITQPTPFQFCIAPRDIVEAGIVESQMKLFVETMLETLSIDVAIKQLQPHYDYFHSHEFFCSQFIGYLKKHAHGSGREKFVEELTTKILCAQSEDKKNIKTARRIARAEVRSNRMHFDRLSNIFLHGARGISFEQVEKYSRIYS
ncbi:hypothetical protein ACSFBM_15535 [Variovorax sp. GB1R11]|uniref:hypothetical protein n=1 Tax=Variovorax sp. GB1R11 TaxID=3443741 RepID=UPI003F47283F